MELWSLLSIAAPGLFPNPERFRDYYARPIEKRGNADLLAQLRRRIRPLIMRRTKEQVAADLPAKQEQVLEVELHPRHRKVYQTHLQRERQKVLGLLDDINANRFTILRSLTLLRQLQPARRAWSTTAHGDLPCAQDRRAARADRRTWPAAGTGRWCSASSPGSCGSSATRLDAAGVRYCYLDGKTRDRAAVLRRVQGRHGAGVPDQPQGRRLRAEPHRGRLLLPARPLVEPGDRDPGHRPDPPHRADPERDGLPPHRARTRSRKRSWR